VERRIVRGGTASLAEGLQVHGVGRRTNDLSIRFRNIRIRELP
jgi:hypothetical protein